STRSIIPRRTALPKPAIGPERSWIEPMVISVLLTPCVGVCATASEAASASVAVVRMRLMVVSKNVGPKTPMASAPKGRRRLGAARRRLCDVHRVDQRGVFLLHQAALELHRRRELFVFGAELRLQQAEALDLLDARELGIHLGDLALDQPL